MDQAQTQLCMIESGDLQNCRTWIVRWQLGCGADTVPPAKPDPIKCADRAIRKISTLDFKYARRQYLMLTGGKRQLLLWLRKVSRPHTELHYAIKTAGLGPASTLFLKDLRVP